MQKKYFKSSLFLCIGLLLHSVFVENLYAIQSDKTPLIFLVSIRKCGTHLLEKCISSLTGKKSFYAGHRPIATSSIIEECANVNASKFFLESHHSVCTEKELNFIADNTMLGVFIYRDPRDQIISLIHYVKKEPKNPLYDEFINKSLDDLIFVCIDLLPLTYTNRLGWIGSPRVYTTTFEKLVGSKGGGSDEQQLQELRNIAQHLKLTMPDHQIAAKAKDLFGGTYTFREGKIGSWKNYFNEQHKEYFKKQANQLLIDLGYEISDEW